MSDKDLLDTRVREPIPYLTVCKRLFDEVAKAQHIAATRGKQLPEKVKEQISLLKYYDAVVEKGGPVNKTIMLPSDWKLDDLISIMGMPDLPEPGSDESWKAARRRYDSTQTSSGNDGGLTRTL